MLENEKHTGGKVGGLMGHDINMGHMGHMGHMEHMGGMKVGSHHHFHYITILLLAHMASIVLYT